MMFGCTLHRHLYVTLAVIAEGVKGMIRLMFGINVKVNLT